MSKTLEIEFSGGFHGYGSAVVRARIEDKGTYLGAYISAGQARKLRREFCGMADCLCGAESRADMDIPAGWDARSEYGPEGGLIACQDKA